MANKPLIYYARIALWTAIIVFGVYATYSVWQMGVEGASKAFFQSIFKVIRGFFQAIGIPL